MEPGTEPRAFCKQSRHLTAEAQLRPPTLSAESLATEVALEGFLPSMGPQVHIEVGLLGKGMMAELADVGPLVPVEAEGKRNWH